MHRRLLVLVATSLGTLVTTRALAQAPVYVAQVPSGSVPLTLHADRPGVVHKITSASGAIAPFTCVGDCTVWLPRGRYRVDVDGDLPRAHRVLDVLGASRIDTEAGSSSERTTGLVLGITGSAAAGVGLALLLLTGMEGALSEGSKQGAPERQRDGWIALGVFGGGALLSTVGWLTFAGARTKMEVGSGAPRWSVKPSTVGWGLAVEGRF